MSDDQRSSPRVPRAEAGTVSVRAFGIEKDLGAMPMDEFASALAEEIAGRGASTVKEQFKLSV